MILGYFVDKDAKPSPANIFVAIDEKWARDGDMITCYSPIGQHSPLDRNYLEECKAISKEDYIKYSNGLWTPLEYLTFPPASPRP